MILYCGLSYFFAFGILMVENEKLSQFSKKEWIFLFLAPISVPIYVGYRFETD